MPLLEACKENLLTQQGRLETMKTVTRQQNSICRRYKIRGKRGKVKLLRRVELTWEARTHRSPVGNTASLSPLQRMPLRGCT